jgi:hypothetical protein
MMISSARAELRSGVFTGEQENARVSLMKLLRRSSGRRTECLVGIAGAESCRSVKRLTLRLSTYHCELARVLMSRSESCSGATRAFFGALSIP